MVVVVVILVYRGAHEVERREAGCSRHVLYIVEATHRHGETRESIQVNERCRVLDVDPVQHQHFERLSHLDECGYVQMEHRTHGERLDAANFDVCDVGEVGYPVEARSTEGIDAYVLYVDEARDTRGIRDAHLHII